MDAPDTEFNIADVPLPIFTQLTDSLIDEVCGFVPEPWIQIANELSPAIRQLKSAKEDFLKLIIAAVYCPDDRRSQFLSERFTNDKTEYLCDLILQRKLDLAKSLRKEHNASVMPVLDDFDWSVKLILGNSSSTVMKYKAAELQLNILSRDKKKANDIFLELTEDELDLLIDVLQEQYNK